MSQKNDVKKVTIVEFHPTSPAFKEETKEETSSEELTVGETTVGENEDYLDVEELILYLVKIKKVKD